jgi:GTPase SAR1 family protein
MNDLSDEKIFFCGLPSSGKTTFMAALGYLLENNEVEKEFELTGLPTERRFFNELADRWLRCEPMLRTEVSSSDKIRMNIKKKDLHISIEMPDFSGETWERLWSEHEIDNVLIAELEKSPSIVIFIQSDHVHAPMSLTDESEMISRKEPILSNESAVPWEPTKHVPTQAVLVDLLRKISSFITRAHKDTKLVIVLSAWDTVGSDITPELFIEREMPLLHQYLNCRFDFNHFSIFGVSAQGGDLEDSEITEKLLYKDNPSMRVKVVNDGIENSDLTRILSWLINR